MDLYQGLLTRRSVRQFDTTKKVSKQDILQQKKRQITL